MCNVSKRTSCRDLFKKLSILTVPCVYIMETTLHIKMNKERLKQNLDTHEHETRYRSDFQTQFCRSDILKKSVTNMGAKLYNRLPNYIKNVENLKPFKKQIKTFLLHHTFHSVDEYLAHNQGKRSSLYYPRDGTVLHLLYLVY